MVNLLAICGPVCPLVSATHDTIADNRPMNGFKRISAQMSETLVYRRNTSLLSSAMSDTVVSVTGVRDLKPLTIFDPRKRVHI